MNKLHIKFSGIKHLNKLIENIYVNLSFDISIHHLYNS